MKILMVADSHMDSEASQAIAAASKKVPFTFVGGDIGLRRDEDPEHVADYIRDTFKSERTFITPGNHDFWPVNLLHMYEAPSNIEVVVDRRVKIHDPASKKEYKVWFSPWSVQFANWNWMLDDMEADYFIPEDVDYIVTHGPAFTICDECPDGHNAGSLPLLDAINQTKAKCVFSGHIHGYSYEHHINYGREWYNISVLNEQYRFKWMLPIFDTETGDMEYWTEKDWN